jgi:hypothetical protein
MQGYNTEKRLISLTKYLYNHSRSNYFKLGYDDALKDLEYRYDISNTDARIFYARGRAFAVYCKQTKQPRAVWRKGILAKTAQERLHRATVTGWVI